ncbi:MAG: helix-turn-helix domain-containing protein [Verrucomicrobiales bacterium]|nr:MAG: helix-turn-helix domain-containing protein [Verrucomicrobiales bacterium]
MKLKTKITQVRAALQITQPTLAHKLGVSPRTIWSWESGESVPKKFVLKGLVEQLDNLLNAE